MYDNIMHMMKSASRYNLVCAIVFLFLFSIVIYSGSLSHGFVWDDEATFANAEEIRSLKNIPSFFVLPLALGDSSLTAESDNKGTLKYYRPLLATLHAVEYHFFKANPLGYKIVSILLNSVAVICAFLLVRTLTGSVAVSFFAALLYAANPARGEVVYWSYSDSYMLVAIFSLLTMLLYCYGNKIPALLCMVIALLFQETAILVPAILLAYELFCRPTKWSSMRSLAPFFLLALMYMFLRRLFVGAMPLTDLSFLDWLRACAYILIKYVQICFVTDAPVTMYRYVPGMFGADGVVTTSIFLFSGLFLLFGVWLILYQRQWFFWYAWFVVFVSISFNVGFATDYLLAEKSMYLASLGPSVLVSALWSDCKQLRWIFLVILSLLIGYQTITTVERGQYWSDTVTYLEKLLEFEPNYDVAQYQLGVKYLEIGQYEKAVYRFEALGALQSPLGQHRYNTWLLAEAYGRWGQLLAQQRDFEKAKAVLEKSLEVLPGQAVAYNRLGVLYELWGDCQRAVASWRKALKIAPTNTDARFNLEKYKRNEALIQECSK